DYFALVSAIVMIPQSLKCVVGLAGAFWRVFPQRCLVVLVEVLPGPACVASAVLLAAVFSLMCVVWLGCILARFSQDGSWCFWWRFSPKLLHVVLVVGRGQRGLLCPLRLVVFACGFWAGACGSTVCLCLSVSVSCRLEPGCIALYLGWLPMLVIAPCVVSGALSQFSLLLRERVCLGMVPCFGLGPSEVDVMSLTSAVVSVPVWLCIFLVVGMLVPVLSLVCAWRVCCQLLVDSPLCVALVSLEADGGVSCRFVR
ncbi:hypothetical protein Taro_013440, partial [Colocasia esculenta]|nr:hypothetical protein [Colocasia esculenta]